MEGARQRDLVEFIKEVEKHPCIYNVTMPEYSNRNETKRAWVNIAENLAISELECKEKWRKIRIAFIRSLKHMKTTNQSNKPYYLYDYLTFLLPFVKINDHSVQDHDESAIQMSPFSDDDDILAKKPQKVEAESDDDSRYDTSGRHVVYFDETSNEPFVQERKRQVIENRKRKRTECVEDNPRKMFLLSILPDVETFSEEEMRVFRRDVVNSIDNIMDARKIPN